jgi:hypothetical protein
VRLLVSLCSSTTEAPEAVVVYDADMGTVEPVSLPDSGAGVFGLCVANGSIYCLIDQGRPSPDEAERSGLCRLDSATLAVRWGYAFRVGRDVHSVAAGGHRPLVTSTGTDEVLELALDDQGRIEDERVIWRPNPGSERADRHHVHPRPPRAGSSPSPRPRTGPSPAGLRSTKGVGPYLEFLRTPDVKTVKNRVHLDLRPYPGDDQAAEVARLRALGATDIDVGQGDVSWTVLADPEGNEFCVLTPR